MLDDLDVDLWCLSLRLVLLDALLGRCLFLLAVDPKLELLREPLFRRVPFLDRRALLPLLLTTLAEEPLVHRRFLRLDVWSQLFANELVLGVLGIFLLLDVVRLEDGCCSSRS